MLSQRLTRLSLPIVILLMISSALFLSWPALVNGGGLAFQDSIGYYKGGFLAVQKIASIAQSHLSSSQAAPATDDIEKAVQSARAIRSAFYSLFMYLIMLLGGSISVALIQASIL